MLIQLRFEMENNKMIRALVSPLKNYSRKMAVKTFANTSDAEYLKSLKDIHKGQRCFIIGNGPSLQAKDLDKLKNEVTFASNRIYHIFPKTDWRPTYYVCLDLSVLNTECEHIQNPALDNIFLSTVARPLITQKSNVHFFQEYGKFEINKFDVKNIEMSEDISKYISIGYSVTTASIQMAFYMGFQTIYLLGVDHNYAMSFNKNGKIINDPSVKTYFGGSKEQFYSIQSTLSVTRGYESAYRFARKKGIHIFNATRGGKLEVFPRVDFDTLFD